MRIEEFDYELPQDRIAQVPAARREESRLLLLDRGREGVGETTFARLGDHLASGDLLVLNDTRVAPARLRARKPTGGRVEILLLPPADDAGPERACLLSTSQGVRAGTALRVADDLEALVVEEPRGGRARVRLRRPGRGAPGEAALLARAVERAAVMPLPPYIRRVPGDPRDGLDRERYQTVYAAREGAVAAPTAGLHFTPAVLADLETRGVATTRLTLHVGPGTFLPVRSARIEDHAVEPERCVVPEAAARAVAACRARGGRVVAVGTTVTRALEARAGEDGTLRPGEGWCDLYIRPGHRFRAVDVLLTNLHLPRSSLLILVAAFAGRERVLDAYRQAIARGFRFYSYGDAMLIT